MKDFILIYPRLVIHPHQTFQRLSLNPPATPAFIVYFLVSALTSWQLGAQRSQEIQYLAQYWPLIASPIGWTLAGCLMSLLYTGLLTMFFQFLSRLFSSHRAPWESIWTAIVLIFTGCGLLSLVPYSSLLVTLWSVLWTAFALMNIYKISWLKAAGWLALEYGVILVIVLHLVSFVHPVKP